MSAWGRSSTPTVAVDHVPTIAAAAVPVNDTIISDTAAPPVVAPATNTNPTAAPHIYEEIRGQANPPLPSPADLLHNYRRQTTGPLFMSAWK
jgi:hypothetical protein